MSDVVQWVVDHIEEGVAAIEVDGARLLQLPLAQLPVGLREGDVLRVEMERVGGRVVLRIERDPDATRRAMAAPPPPPPGARPDPGGHITL